MNKKLIPTLVVIFGVWMVFWPPVEVATAIAGPVWSMTIGVVIIVIGAILWKVKAF